MIISMKLIEENKAKGGDFKIVKIFQNISRY